MARAYASHQTADQDLDLQVGSTPETVRRSAAPLVVGAADDRAEREADRVADEVVNRLQGGTTGASHVHDGCHGVARAEAPASSGGAEVGYEGGAISDGLTSRIEAKRGGGSALPDRVRGRMESGFGRSLGDVRVHTDGEAADLNRSISARAFTTGKDIFFGAGEYAPDTPGGEKVLAHELAHTQQSGGGARRIHRKWDVKAKDLDLIKVNSVGVFESRPIIILTHPDDGDKLVVKGEDQPVGLGQLTAKMHKKASKTSSVKQRLLSKREQGDISFVLGKGVLDASWDARGREVMKSTGVTGGDAKEAAVADVLNALHSKKNKVVAMTFADGTGADKLADPANYTPKGNEPARGDDDKTEYRKLIMDPKHLQALGRITAVDAFMGNMDRVANANAGNWFVNTSTKSIQLIDSVDPGERTSRVSMAESFQVGAWEAGTSKRDTRMVAGSLFFDKKRGDALAGMIAQAMSNAGVTMDDSGFSVGGDMKVNQWFNKTMADGTVRADFVAKHLEAGFVAGKAHILKIFAAPKWHDFKLNKKRKSLMKSAASAEAMDGAGPNAYYQELARRAQLIKTAGV